MDKLNHQTGSSYAVRASEAFLSARRISSQRARFNSPTRSTIFSKIGSTLGLLIHAAYWFFVWLMIRLNPGQKPVPRVLFFYAPQRTPRRKHEFSHDFVRRITRSNRQNTLIDLLEIDEETEIQCIQVLSGISSKYIDQGSSSLTHFLLKQTGFREAVKLLNICIRIYLFQTEQKSTLLSTIIELFAWNFSQNSQTLVMTTSNTTILECARLAAIASPKTHFVELLHGHVSMALEPYYSFIKQQALSELTYIDLIADFPRFRAIKSNLLRDENGCIAINCQLCAKADTTSETDLRINVDLDLLESRPVVFIGGLTADKDFLSTPIFEQEVRVISAIRQMLPNRPIYYCPHPVNIKLLERIKAELGDLEVEITTKSTLGMSLHAFAVIGAYSTSSFEAACLGIPTLLLPFDRTVVFSDLVKLPAIYSIETQDDQFTRDSISQIFSSIPTSMSLEDRRERALLGCGLVLN